MLKEKGFYRGINLGGWMSQCDYSEERLNGFITEKDIARIASWGLDHVRLPVDYNVLENAEGTAFLDEGFDRINRAGEWCRKHGLNMVIDLHKTAERRRRAFSAAERIRSVFTACGSGSRPAAPETRITWRLNC